MRAALCIVLLAAPAALAVPVQPQSTDWLSANVETEVRLKKADGTTARLVKPAFPTYNARYFILTEPCWNKSSACPEITGATISLFVKLPWSNRLNVTKYVLCGATVCDMPAFGPLIAKPGEGYRLRYDRVTARWDPMPSVVSVAPAPPPPTPPPPSGASPDGTKMPPAALIVDATGDKWTVSASGNQFAVFRNATQVANSVDFLTIKGGVIYQSDFLSGTGWSRWSGSAWIDSAAP
jgi:hypothetical protein